MSDSVAASRDELIERSARVAAQTLLAFSPVCHDLPRPGGKLSAKAREAVRRVMEQAQITPDELESYRALIRTVTERIRPAVAVAFSNCAQIVDG